MNGYCLRCRAKQDMIDSVAVTIKGGRRAIQGRCAVCSTNITRFGVLEEAQPVDSPLNPSYRPVTAVLGLAFGALGLLFTRRLVNRR